MIINVCRFIMVLSKPWMRLQLPKSKYHAKINMKRVLHYARIVRIRILVIFF